VTEPFLKPVATSVPADVRAFQVLVGVGVIVVWIVGAWALFVWAHELMSGVTWRSAARLVNTPLEKPIRDEIKPSFDCLQAQTPTERIICADPNLARLDVQMVAAYRDLLATQASPAKLQRDHVAWFKLYSNACNALPGQVNQPARIQCVQQRLTVRRDFYLRAKVSQVGIRRDQGR
jgi:uncharacterized protein YecT (DUF1311 family)